MPEQQLRALIMYNRLKRLSWMVNHILEKMRLELAVEGWAELGSREEHGQLGLGLGLGLGVGLGTG